jgi:hypothetical protein
MFLFAIDQYQKEVGEIIHYAGNIKSWKIRVRTQGKGNRSLRLRMLKVKGKKSQLKGESCHYIKKLLGACSDNVLQTMEYLDKEEFEQFIASSKVSFYCGNKNLVD